MDVESASVPTVNPLPPNNGLAPNVTGSALGTGNSGFTNIASLQPPTPRVRVVRLDAAGGSFLNVVDDDTTTLPIDLGVVSLSSSFQTFFRIENWGQAALNLGAVTTSAPFTVATAPTSPVASSTSTEFSLNLDTTTEGTFLSTIAFTTDDPAITPPLISRASDGLGDDRGTADDHQQHFCRWAER
ncbi:MAG: DUF1573 domain-containing protein [Spirulinaceae cyanobacterium RM2_2_10]|nr:DUF1573 domain-containing protein [Spirulinaceae cyanobacterium RM2_2_10]